MCASKDIAFESHKGYLNTEVCSCIQHPTSLFLFCHSFEGSRTDLINKTDHEACKWDTLRLLSHEWSTNKTDLACLMKINFHKLKCFWSGPDFQNDTLPQKLVSLNKMNCNNSKSCWLISLKFASFIQRTFPHHTNSLQLHAGKRSLKLLEFPVTLVKIWSKSSFLGLSLLIYEINM